ncbi:MAG: hypothetical protein U0792_05825 [Gemmataceae bacterium]
MSQSRHVVRRRNWRWAPGNDFTPRGWVCFPGPGTGVAEFESFDDAEQERWKREAAVRVKMNPFECGPLPAVSSLPEPILRDFLMDTGIVPPNVGTPWESWWNANRSALTDEQTARVWEAADKVRFFEITEEAAGPEVHVVVDVSWEQREDVHVAEWEGGEPVRVCRHVQRAGEIARGRANQQRIVMAGQHGVDGGPFVNCRPCNVPDPFTPGATRLQSLAVAPFSEVFTIPFDDTSDAGPLLPPSGELCVVVRHDYAPTATGIWSNPAGRASGVPVRAFVDWEQAVDFVEGLLHEQGAWFNPFRLVTIPEALTPDGNSSRLWRAARALGLSAPDDNSWHTWWIEHVMGQNQDDARLWYALGLQFYTVLAVPFEK